MRLPPRYAVISGSSRKGERFFALPSIPSLGNYIEENPNGQKVGVRCEGQGDLGVRFDRLNELRGEAREVLEPVVPEPVEGSKGRGRGHP